MRLTRYGAPLLVLALVAPGCDALTGPSHTDRLAEAVLRWEGAQQSSYEMDLIRRCYCGYVGVGEVVTIRVENGAIVDARFKESGDPIEGEHRDELPTVSSLFALIADAIERKAYTLTVQYHPVHGAPMSIDIDYVKNAEDDELSFSIRDLRSPDA
ncbi:MAG TPA: DUF6174 domain-containing protein [Gemmatimonadales bacterium]|nr:DUF6174 domain-containing protein [Gemmatimonadales bacterium]